MQIPPACPRWEAALLQWFADPCASVCSFPLVFCVFPLCFCRGVGLLSCRVKPSGDVLVFTPLSWECPELVRAPRCCHTRIYNESCVSTRCLCKTCTRFQQEVTESFPWEAAMGEGIGRFLQRDSSKNCFFFKAKGRTCPEWGGCAPSPDPPCSPVRSPRSSLWWSPRARAAPGAWPSLRWAKPSAPATALKKRFRASRGCSQPGGTLGCHWVLLPFCFILFTI